MGAQHCPVCNAQAYGQRADTPYFVCPSCDCWFQDLSLPKVMHGAHEGPPEAMSEADKSINADLALALYKRYLEPVETWGQKRYTLDIGCSYPWLAHSLKNLGCAAFGMEPGLQVTEWCQQLGVMNFASDFESCHVDYLPSYRFHLITMVHVFEHMYAPKDALYKLREMIEPQGRVYLRMPAHDVPGFERDLTEGHYSIHPFFHCYSSIMQAIVETKCFTVETTYPLVPGCRDYVLKPIV